jgi:hypothetical protein
MPPNVAFISFFCVFFACTTSRRARFEATFVASNATAFFKHEIASSNSLIFPSATPFRYRALTLSLSDLRTLSHCSMQAGQSFVDVATAARLP